MTCERCGKAIPDNAAICPSCGTVTSAAGAPVPPTTTYGTYPDSQYDAPYRPQPMSTYEQGYMPRQDSAASPFYTPPQNFGPAPNPPPYQSPPINVTVVNNFPAVPQKNNAALITEIILSLFSFYGVGWVMAGETTIGVVLMVLSVVLFWPLAVLIAIFTLGIGIFVCNLPLAIAGIILNAVLLNNRLDRQLRQVRQATFSSYQGQQMQPPPRQMRPQ